MVIVRVVYKGQGYILQCHTIYTLKHYWVPLSNWKWRSNTSDFISDLGVRPKSLQPSNQRPMKKNIRILRKIKVQQNMFNLNAVQIEIFCELNRYSESNILYILDNA